MAKLAALTIASLILQSCSRDEPIKLPEAILENTPIGGENSQGENPSGNETEIPSIGETGSLPTPGEMNLPETLRSFFSEPHEAIGEVASFYNSATGYWPGGFKTSAYAVTALIDYMDRTKTLDFTWILDNTFRKNSFVSDNFEDSALWGITWLLAYDLTKEARYFNTAKQLHDQVMAQAWDDVCGGGLYAKTDKATKSAAANLLALRLASMLSQRAPTETSYQDNSQRLWSWISTSPLLDSSQLVKNSLQSTTCMPEDSAFNTQSQGLMLSALIELYKVNSKVKLLEAAKVYASRSAVEFRDAEGAFIEKATPECQPCTGEEPLYKGIMIQGLTKLYQATKDETWNKILNQNANLAWTKSKGPGGMLGYKWQSASDGYDSIRQAAGALLMNSTIQKPFDHNFAFGGDTRASSYCNANETASQAFDGSASTKWCGGMIDGINHLSVDLGALRNIKSVRILHAGAGGEGRTLNTKDFELQISSNGSDFTELAKIIGNESSMSLHRVSGTGRYLRLRFSDPGADGTGRIYEISVE